MRECVCGEQIRHMFMLHTFRESLLCNLHRGLSDQCKFIGISDTICFATAELERHYLQNECEKYNIIDIVYKLHMRCNLHIKAN